MSIYGFIGIGMGLLLVIFPNLITQGSVLPKLGKKSVGVSVRKPINFPNATLFIRIGGAISILLGVLEIIGVINLS